MCVCVYIYIYMYYLSVSPNNVADRHKHWFGSVKMAWRPFPAFPNSTDNAPETCSNVIMTNDVAFCDITQTTSSDGVMGLNFEIRTSAIVDPLIVILH